MLKHFINIICMVVIMTLMVACAEPYDNEPYEEPEEIIEDIYEINEELIEIVENIGEPIEIIEDINEEDLSNKIIEESYNEGPTPAIKLDVILDIFIHQHLNKYFTGNNTKYTSRSPYWIDFNHNNMPDFCWITNHFVSCTLPHEIQEELDNDSTLDSLYYDYTIEYCDNCNPRKFVESIAIVALMQKLNLLSSDCDITDNIYVSCDITNDDNTLFCAHRAFSFTTLQPKSIEDIELSCDNHWKDSYDPALPDNDRLATYNGIWIVLPSIL